MFKATTTILVVFLVHSIAFASTYERHPVSPLAWEVKVLPAEQFFLRYVEFSYASEYPCLRLETLTGAYDYKIQDRKDICEVRLGQEIFNVQHGVTAAYFKNYRIDMNIFYFDMEVISLHATSYFLTCEVYISDSGILSGPVCKESTHQTDSD